MDNLFKAVRNYNYAVSWVILTALFLLSPLLERRMLGEFVLDSLYTTLIILLVARLQSQFGSARPIGLPALFALTPILGLLWVDTYVDGRWLQVIEHLLLTLFFGGITILVFIDLFRSSEVSLNHLAGCATSYLLLAFTFASIFYTLSAVYPPGFEAPVTHRFFYSDALYFSALNLTTLSYGDPVPPGYLARSIGALEAITGQLFMAIFVGHMVGMYIHHRSTERRKVKSDCSHRPKV